MEYITRKTKYSLEYVNFDVNFNETSSKTTHHTQGIRVQIKTETKKSKNIKPEIKRFQIRRDSARFKKNAIFAICERLRMLACLRQSLRHMD